MNNDQFRKLVQNTPRNPAPSDQGARNGATPSAALGSRMRSSIPMTPRSLGIYNPTNDFARQLAERNAQSSSSTTKKFRTTATPKGAKLPTGYVDRVKAREAEDEEGSLGEKVQRVKALEDMMKLGQIDAETFEKLREEILGDEVGSRAGVVKGLDWRLLERVRRGEVGVGDVLGTDSKKKEQGEEGVDDEVNVDDEFEELEAASVEAVVKNKVKKKGEMAPPELTGKKRNRDQILAEMKAARLAAKEAAKPSLGAKFKRVGEKRTVSRIERDGKGREVLITVDESGNEKRKVRRVQVEEVEEKEKDLGLLMPDKDVKPLGMEVPDVPKVEEEEEDIDIFDDVGDDYDPLAGLVDSDSEKEDAEAEEGEVAETSKTKEKVAMPPPPRPAQPPRNYFGTPTTSSMEPSTDRPKALTDPTLLAAIKKASTINAVPAPKDADEIAKEAKRRKMLQQDDRDAQDMDMGFGSSRFEDEEDFEEKKIKLSEWGGNDEDGDDGGKGGDKGKRKRGPKKRKGDANSAADVMAVLERRKGEKK